MCRIKKLSKIAFNSVSVYLKNAHSAPPPSPTPPPLSLSVRLSICLSLSLPVCMLVLACVRASATAMLRTLHWLPVKARIQNKIACPCFQCICQNSMPPYISDLLHPYCPSRTLRSLDTSLLTVPRFSLETFGKKSFSVFGPTVWNSLPLTLRKTQCF